MLEGLITFVSELADGQILLYVGTIMLISTSLGFVKYL